MIVSEGKMVDASFHEVPRQCNSREENKEIKEGVVPGTWNKKICRTKISMHVGRKRIMKHFMGIKTI
jgi:hypothetical protein